MPDRFHTLHTPAVAEDLIDPREQKIRRLTARVAELEQTNRRLTQRIGEIQRLAADTLTETEKWPDQTEHSTEPADRKEKKQSEIESPTLSWKERRQEKPASTPVTAPATAEKPVWLKNLNLPVALTVLSAVILINLFLNHTYQLDAAVEFGVLGLLLGLFAYVCMKHTQTTRVAGALGMLLGGALLFLLDYGQTPLNALIIVFYLVMWLVSGLIRWKFGDGKKPTVAAAILCGMVAPIASVVSTESLDALAESAWLIFCISYALCLFGLTCIQPKGESKKAFWILFGVVAAVACGLGIYIAAALS